MSSNQFPSMYLEAIATPFHRAEHGSAALADLDLREVRRAGFRVPLVEDLDSPDPEFCGALAAYSFAHGTRQARRYVAQLRRVLDAHADRVAARSVTIRVLPCDVDDPTPRAPRAVYKSTWTNPVRRTG